VKYRHYQKIRLHFSSNQIKSNKSKKYSDIGILISEILKKYLATGEVKLELQEYFGLISFHMSRNLLKSTNVTVYQWNA
jgi:hypothetical protein